MDTLSDTGSVMLADFISRQKRTQADFAREVQCSEPHLSLILKGKKKPSPGLAKRISDASGIPVRALSPKFDEITEILDAAE